MRRLIAALVRKHHERHVKDFEAEIDRCTKRLEALPAHIANLHQHRKYHVGRVETLKERRTPVVWGFGARDPRRQA
jgi:hypothetical protein